MHRPLTGIKLWIGLALVIALAVGATRVAAGVALSARSKSSHRALAASAPSPYRWGRRFRLWIVAAAPLAVATVAIGTAVALALPSESRSTDQARDAAALGQTAYYNARTVSVGPRTGTLGFRLVATQTSIHQPTPTVTPSPTPIPSPTPTATPRPPFVWPAHGPISQGMHAKHPSGIDVAVNTGEPIYAVRDGRVQYAGGDPCCSYGYFMVLEHDQGWTSLYAHLSAFRAVAGQEVTQGQLIGLSGESGKARGAHLHFELRMGGVPVNPMEHLPPP